MHNNWSVIIQRSLSRNTGSWLAARIVEKRAKEMLAAGQISVPLPRYLSLNPTLEGAAYSLSAFVIDTMIVEIIGFRYAISDTERFPARTKLARTTWMEQRRCWSCNFASLYEFGQVRIAETVEESAAESWSNLCRITTWTRSRGARWRSISDNASK